MMMMMMTLGGGRGWDNLSTSHGPMCVPADGDDARVDGVWGLWKEGAWGIWGGGGN